MPQGNMIGLEPKYEFKCKQKYKYHVNQTDQNGGIFREEETKNAMSLTITKK